MNSTHDIIIIGGGIAGLYTAFHILQSNPKKKILILEKQKRIGGRIHTYEDEYMHVEAGAGRIHSSHKLLLTLIETCQLHKKLKPIHSTPSYIDCTTGHHYPEQIGNKLIQQVIQHGSRTPDINLRQVSFISFASQILSSVETQYIKNSFGFSTELYYMNAYDAITLMKTLISTKPFYYLAGGFQQVVECLAQRIQSLGGHIQCQSNVIDVRRSSTTNHTLAYDIEYTTNNHSHSSPKQTTVITSSTHCIFALPKECLPHFRVFKNTPYSQYIYCGSLCRIYTKFRKGGEWFQHLSKFTTQNDLRMVIPMNPVEGTMMISYSDNIYADRWFHLYKTLGMKKIKQYLRKLLAETLGMEVPPLGATRIFYWDCGVGYWKVGANSKEISRKIAKPWGNHNIYVCGEHYSSIHQQWVEGALETSTRVLKLLGVHLNKV
jgi:hypothetical protein